MTTDFIHLWCEWDYGQDDMIFTSEDHAKIWLGQAMLEIDGEQSFNEEWPNGVDEVFDAGLAGFKCARLFVLQ